MPVPKVVPTKILAQFEQEEQTMQAIKQGTFTMNSATQKGQKGAVEGFDRKYMSVRDQERPTYEKPHRLEGSIGQNFDASASMQLSKPKVKHEKQHPYEELINKNLQENTGISPNSYPSVTFESKELYD
jgi:hypothetical protein